MSEAKLAAGAAQRIEAWTDEAVLEVAAAVCRERARESFRLTRNTVAATREASQLTHLALRLDGIRVNLGEKPTP